MKNYNNYNSEPKLSCFKFLHWVHGVQSLSPYFLSLSVSCPVLHLSFIWISMYSLASVLTDHYGRGCGALWRLLQNPKTLSELHPLPPPLGQWDAAIHHTISHVTPKNVLLSETTNCCIQTLYTSLCQFVLRGGHFVSLMYSCIFPGHFISV